MADPCDPQRAALQAVCEALEEAEQSVANLYMAKTAAEMALLLCLSQQSTFARGDIHQVFYEECQKMFAEVAENLKALHELFGKMLAVDF